MLASSVRNVNPILDEVSESSTPTPQSPPDQRTQPSPNPVDSPKKESRFEFSFNWFDQLNINGSCTESAWKQLAEKLKSPLKRGLAIGTGIAIGVGATVYGFVQIDKALNPAHRSTPIDAPAQKK
jgi:hypothetical protein